MEDFANSLKRVSHRGPNGEGILLINTKTGTLRSLRTNETPKDIVCDYNSVSDIDALFEFNLILGHRRLSIIDLSSAGHQPMVDGHGNAIIFNGEVYNFQEIKDGPDFNSEKFVSQTDTEVILKSYVKYGPNYLKNFNGMFSIIIWDNLNKKLFVTNDRFGVKPLYYHKNSEELIFASEIKQLLGFGINKALNAAAVDNFLEGSYTDYDDTTFFRSVNRYKNSNHSVIDINNDHQEFKLIQYYQFPTSVVKIDEKNAIEQFRALLDDSVKLRLRSDVKVGFASSGGLDSSAILYSAHTQFKKQGIKNNIRTFSAVFQGLEGDESEFIKIVEKDLADIECYYTNPFEEFNIADFESYVYQQDFPVQAVSNISASYLAKSVKKNGVIVLLEGQGADELLAGYHHHFYRYCRELILKGHILKYLSLVKSYAEIKGIPINKLHRQTFNDVKLVIKYKLGLEKIQNKLSYKWNKANDLISLLKIDFSELSLPFYLRSDDREGMLHSIETRHPFLDYRLVDFCYSLPNELKIKNGWQKYILREAIEEMPAKIRYRKDKKGYTAPETIWQNKYRNEFDSYLNFLPDYIKKKTSLKKFSKIGLGAWIKANKLSL